MELVTATIACEPCCGSGLASAVVPCSLRLGRAQQVLCRHKAEVPFQEPFDHRGQCCHALPTVPSPVVHEDHRPGLCVVENGVGDLFRTLSSPVPGVDVPEGDGGAVRDQFAQRIRRASTVRRAEERRHLTDGFLERLAGPLDLESEL